MAQTKTVRMPFKRGDDFIVDFTLTDTNHTTAISLKATLTAEQTALEVLEAADPLDPAAVAAQAAVVQAADDAYEAVIIMDISGWEITSQIRLRDKLINDLTVDMANAVIGKFALKMGNTLTQLWKPYEHLVDIQFSRVAGKISSETFIVDVVKDVTYG